MSRLPLMVSRGVAGHLAMAVHDHIEKAQRHHQPIPRELPALRDALAAYARQADGDGGEPAALPDPLPQVEPRLLTYRQAAEALAVSERQLKRLVAAGDLPAASVGGCRRIHVADLDRFAHSLAGHVASDGASEGQPGAGGNGAGTLTASTREEPSR